MLKHGYFGHCYDFEFVNHELPRCQNILYPISAFLKKRINEEPLILSSLYHFFSDQLSLNQGVNDDLLLSYVYADDAGKDALKHRYCDNENFIHAAAMTDEHIRIWLDDMREAPEGYFHCRSVNETISKIKACEKAHVLIDELALDHDLGDFTPDGGDAINLLDFLVQRQTFYKVTLHTANPVGRNNMQRIIDRYWPA